MAKKQPAAPKPVPGSAKRAAERFSAFVESTDPRVATCKAWKSLMQFRSSLLTNPRRDSGASGWWGKWFSTTHAWLYGGAERDEGYYPASYPRMSPGCCMGADDAAEAVRMILEASDRDAATAVRALPEWAASNLVSARSDDTGIVLFPAGTSYFHRGVVVDLAKPFPKIEDRGAIVEWLESWIDLVTRTEAPPDPLSQISNPREQHLKPGGWTRGELIREVKEQCSFSDTNFDRIRRAAKIKAAERGGLGAQRRFRKAELRALIAAVEAGTFRNKETIAAAWTDLLND